MTPRQLEGVAFFVGRDDRLDKAAQMSINAMAARGEPKRLKEQIKELQKD